jgi:hypothetical protein
MDQDAFFGRQTQDGHRPVAQGIVQVSRL